QVFDFALPLDSPIKSPKDLAGKTISLGSSGWQVIVDPMLVELGLDPKSVKYVTAGAQWTQAVSTGKADAALAWEGLRHQLAGQGWGYNYQAGWANYLKVIHDLGQTKKLLKTSDVITNQLQGPANKKADVAKARADAKAFKLSSQFAATKVDPSFTM